MGEIDKLRSDLEVLKRYEPMVYSLAAARAEIENKIARLEAEADPWRKHNELMDVWRRTPAETHSPHRLAVELVDHLTAELAAKDKRIAELEAALRRIATVPHCGCVPCRGQCESAEALKTNAEEIREIARSAVEGVKPAADMVPSFEGPIVGIEPILDPARVLATACGILEEQGWVMNDEVREELKCGAKPYRLKGADDAK